MSLLSELKSIAENCGVKVETGVFSDTPPDEYIVLTPLTDSFEMHCDNLPEYEIQEVRISIFSKGNYTALKYKLLEYFGLSYDPTKVLEREQYWKRCFDTIKNGYNDN